MEYPDDDTVNLKVEKLLKLQEPLIFLSYAKEDTGKVRAIYKRLRIEQLNPWLDVAELLPGEEWDKAIIKAIRSARFVIVFLSYHSVNKRGFVQKEIKEALDVADRMPEGDIFIIPVRLEACPVPDRLSRWQWIDLFRPHGFSKIVKALKENLASEKKPISTPRINAKLAVVREADHEALFHLRKAVSLIGRSYVHLNVTPDIDLARFDGRRTVSRTHALIFSAQDTFVIKDCGSTNGTIVNDSVILKEDQTRVLKSGDRLRLGDVVLHFIID